jgi:hypothetical protein
MKNRELIIWLIFLSAITLVPISSYSIWLDESMTAFMVSQPNLRDLFYNIMSTHLSESQMPGYLFYVWNWVQVFGISEFSLRAANYPFVMLFIAFVLFSPMEKNKKLLIAFLISFSPIIWYYLNEARYVVIVFSLSGISIISLLYYFSGSIRQKKIGIVAFTASIITGTAFNMLFLFSLIPVLILIVSLIIRYKPQVKNLWKEWSWSLIIMTTWLILIVSYYLWTVLKGSGGMREVPGIGNIAYSIYELLGFIGIGPSRDIIRENQSFQIFQPYLIQLILMGLLYLYFIGLILFSLKNNIKKLFFDPYFISFAVGFLTFIVVAYVFQFRFWGRHIIHLFPFLIFYVAEVVTFANNQLKSTKPFAVAAILFILFFSYSNFNIRFNELYQKENNRLAVAKAIELSEGTNEIIWITYGGYCAQYYGLQDNINENIPSTWKKVKPVVNIVARDAKEVFTTLIEYNEKEPVIVFFSKTLDYDRDKYFQKFVDSNSYSVRHVSNGIRIYTRLKNNFISTD